MLGKKKRWRNRDNEKRDEKKSWKKKKLKENENWRKTKIEEKLKLKKLKNRKNNIYIFMIMYKILSIFLVQIISNLLLWIASIYFNLLQVISIYLKLFQFTSIYFNYITPDSISNFISDSLWEFYLRSFQILILVFY